jgi:hypothetical protein
MKISADLIISKSSGWSGNEMPWYCNFHDVEKAFELKLGDWPIGKIFQTQNGKFFVTEIHNRGFKSIRAAIKGIRERLRKR